MKELEKTRPSTILDQAHDDERTNKSVTKYEWFKTSHVSAVLTITLANLFNSCIGQYHLH